MTHKAVSNMLLGLVVLTLAGTSVFAADSDDHGVIVFRGNPSWAMATRPASFITPATMPDTTKLYKIYSNLGTPLDAYNDQNAWSVQGSNVNGGQVWSAMPFTPKSDAEVTEIETAVEYYGEGPNGVVISLNKDSSGLPGKVIHTWNLKNLPAFGTCCRLDVSKDAQGLKVKKGTQYWVVASTNSREDSTADAWCLNVKLAVGEVAYNQGSGWQSTNVYPVAAFGVFGKKIKVSLSFESGGRGQ